MFENVSYTNDASGWSHSPLGSARMRAAHLRLAHAGQALREREVGEGPVARAGWRTRCSGSGARTGCRWRGSPPAGRSGRPASRHSPHRSRMQAPRSSSVCVCTTEKVRRVPATAASRPSRSSSACAASPTSPSMPRGTTSNTPVPRSRSTPANARQLVLGGERARDLVAGDSCGGRGCASREAERAGVHARRAMAAIAAMSSAVAAPVPARVTHHVRAHRGVRHLRADVDHARALGRARRGTRGTTPSPSRCPRAARCRGCPRRPPSAR